MGQQRIVLCFRERIDFPKSIKLSPKSWNRSRRCPQYEVLLRGGHEAGGAGAARRHGLPSLGLNL